MLCGSQIASVASLPNVIWFVLATKTEKAAPKWSSLGQRSTQALCASAPPSGSSHVLSADIQRLLCIHPPISPRSLQGPQSVCVLPLLGTGCKISLWSIMSSNQQHLQGQEALLLPVGSSPLLCKSKHQSSCRHTFTTSSQSCRWEMCIYGCVALLLSGLHLLLSWALGDFLGSKINCF